MRHLRTPDEPQSASGEVTANRAIRSIVGLDRIAFAGLDRANERSRQHHLAGLKREPEWRDLVGKPGHTGGGMIEYAGGKPGLFQLAVTVAKGAYPSQVAFQRPQRAAAEHNSCLGGIIGYRIENLSRRLCRWIDPLESRVEYFKGRHDKVGRVENVEHRAVRPGEPLLDDEGQFGLDPRADEPVGGLQAAIGKEH